MIRFLSTLRTRLMLLAILALLPFCALIVGLGGHYYRFVISSAYQNAGSLARLMAAEQERQIEDARHLLMALAGMPSIKARRGDYCGVLTEVLKQNPSGLVNIGLTDASGRSICSGLSTMQPASFGGHEWFQKSLKTRQFAIGAYQIERGSGKTAAIIVLPILDAAGQLQGSIYAALDLAWAARLNALATLPEQSILLMFDRDGMVLQRNPDPGQWRGRRHPDSPFLKQIMSRGASGVLEMPALDGIKRLVAFRTLPSQNGDIYLAVGIPSEIAFAQLDKEFFTTGIGVALAIAAMLAIAWVAGDKLVTDRVHRLVTAVNRFGEGIHDVRSGLSYSSDEIGKLARAFDRMADSINMREKQLQRYYFALDQHAIVSTTDAAGDIIHVNDKFCEVTGYTRDELMGKNHRIFKTEFLSPETTKRMWDTLTHGQVWHSNVCNRSKDGSYFWVASSITPFMDEHGIPVQYIAIRTDITETIAMKDALQRSEETYRLLAENSQDVVALHEADGCFLYVSPSSTPVLGYDPAELVSTNPRSLVHEKDIATVRMGLIQPIRDGQKHSSAIFRVQRKSGKYIWAEGTATPVFGPDGQLMHIQSTLRDITQRREAEDRLRLHDQALQASPSGIMLFSMEQNNPVIYVNPAFETITGFGGCEAVGQDVWRLVRQLMDDHMLSKIRAAIWEKREARVLIQFTRRDGILRWADYSVAPVRDEKKDVTHFVAAFSDMTERMVMVEELTRAKEASEQANLAKTEFVSRVTHELRTPLNFILGFAQLLEAQPQQMTETQMDGVRRIIQSGWHLRELIDEVLDLSRIEAGRLDIQMEDVELRPLLVECADIVKLTAAERRIRIELGPGMEGIEHIRADRKRLKQVLLNLLSNAVKFNREGGSVTIEQEVGAHGRVRVTISDTGPGIDISRQDELFQPFSRLDADKAEIPGTGIGLAISRRFMQLMEGGIGVESVPGQGSAFWIELRCVEHQSLLI